jgi:hypothetical protein
VTRVIVIKGTIDIPGPRALAINLLNSGFAARTFAHTRRFYPGDSITIDDVSVAELERLAALGVCRWGP